MINRNSTGESILRRKDSIIRDSRGGQTLRGLVKKRFAKGQ